MSNRQDQEREQRLAPQRMEVAKAAIQKLNLPIVHGDETKIVFFHKGSSVTYYPYSGWHTGKSIVDGRGLKNLLDQLKP